MTDWPTERRCTVHGSQESNNISGFQPSCLRSSWWLASDAIDPDEVKPCQWQDVYIIPFDRVLHDGSGERIPLSVIYGERRVLVVEADDED